MTFNQEHFNQFILENNVIGFYKEVVELKSGKKSHFYINWRTLTEDVRATEILSHHILQFVKRQGLTPDCFYGVPDGATKVALLTQYIWAKDYSKSYGVGTHRFSMGRITPKDHGKEKDKYFVGEPQGKIIVLEDVTTTGGSLLSTIDQLLQMGKQDLIAIGLTNRNDIFEDGNTVEKLFKQKGLPYFAMSNAIDLLPQAYHIQRPGVDIARKVEQEFMYQGIKRLSLL